MRLLVLFVAQGTTNCPPPQRACATKTAAENDRYLSGKYLVIRVRNSIGLERGVTQLELRKSGFKNKIEKGE